MYRRCEVIHIGEEAGVGVEGGLTAVSRRADATLVRVQSQFSEKNDSNFIFVEIWHTFTVDC